MVSSGSCCIVEKSDPAEVNESSFHNRGFIFGEQRDN